MSKQSFDAAILAAGFNDGTTKISKSALKTVMSEISDGIWGGAATKIIIDGGTSSALSFQNTGSSSLLCTIQLPVPLQIGDVLQFVNLWFYDTTGVISSDKVSCTSSDMTYVNSLTSVQLPSMTMLNSGGNKTMSTTIRPVGADYSKWTFSLPTGTKVQCNRIMILRDN